MAGNGRPTQRLVASMGRAPPSPWMSPVPELWLVCVCRLAVRWAAFRARRSAGPAPWRASVDGQPFLAVAQEGAAHYHKHDGGGQLTREEEASLLVAGCDASRDAHVLEEPFVGVGAGCGAVRDAKCKQDTASTYAFRYRRLRRWPGDAAMREDYDSYLGAECDAGRDAHAPAEKFAGVGAGCDAARDTYFENCFDSFASDLAVAWVLLAPETPHGCRHSVRWPLVRALAVRFAEAVAECPHSEEALRFGQRGGRALRAKYVGDQSPSGRIGGP